MQKLKILKNTVINKINNYIFQYFSDAHKGMAIAGGIALGVSAVVGLGFALAKGLKK